MARARGCANFRVTLRSSHDQNPRSVSDQKTSHASENRGPKGGTNNRGYGYRTHWQETAPLRFRLDQDTRNYGCQ